MLFLKSSLAMYLPSIYKADCVFFLVIFLSCFHSHEAAQSFRQAPADLQVIQQQTAVLRCSVNNLSGRVQWTKGGLALGYDRQIPGFPRYSMVGSEAQGEFDLMITEVQLSDDDEFQCQVGPSPPDPALLGKARLTVLIPPSQPVISRFDDVTVFPDGMEVRVPHDQSELKLSCSANGGKPASTITWYRNAVEITSGVEFTVTDVPNSKLKNAKSVLTIAPSSNDDRAVFKCSANNAALPQPLSSSVTLAVLHPPSQPEITGYAGGQVVQTGDTVELKCKARGGNPLAQVYWYKNGAEIDFSFTIAGDVVENVLVFTVQPSDMNAVYRCDASNLVTTEPLSAQVNMIVWFAPETVEITGHEQAKAGEEKTLKCVTGISNPAATITWFSRGRPVPAQNSKSEPSPLGGFITTSRIKVTLTDNDDQVMYQCHATNEALSTQNPAIATVTLQVMYPPETPVIAGYSPDRKLTAGEIQNLLCTAVGGNPLAALTWWKGDKKLEGAITIAGTIVRSQLSFILKPDDNMATYSCQAINDAITAPLSASVTLQVNFPPTSLEISTEPAQIRAGEQVVITCRSGSSNPASTVTWWKDGQRIQGTDGGMEDAEHGGKSTLSHLTLTPSSDQHGQIYACQAANALIERAVSDAVTLDVRSSPRLPPSAPTSTVILEGEKKMLNFTAKANPTPVTYTWYKGDAKAKWAAGITVLANGAVLNITSAARAQSGDYRLVASNEEGEVSLAWSLDVQYPAAIGSLTDSLTIEKGQEASFVCTVSANPLNAETVTWSRDGYDMSRATIVAVAGTSTLTVAGATKDDSGEFTCTANNGIGGAVTKTTALIVKFAPEIDKSNVKAAADAGEDAQLPCVALGAPEITFSWSKDGADIDLTSDRYIFRVNHDEVVTYTSTLIVRDSMKDDHGVYICTATNELGTDSAEITLDGKGKPDPPSEVRLVNVTHNSITLAWTPGFNGGAEQSFRVRYVQADGDDEGFTEQDAKTQTIFTVKRLKLATEYELAVRAVNIHGDSAYSADVVRAFTSAIAPRAESKQPDDTPLIIILTVSILGMLLLGLNVLLILFFIRRRSKNKNKDNGSDNSQAQMSVAPTVTEDSRSGGSGRSLEDFHEDIYRNYEDEDELRKFLPPNAYLGMDGPYAAGKAPPHMYQQYPTQPRPLASPRGMIGPYDSLPRPVPQQYNSLRKSQPHLGPAMAPPSPLYASLPRGTKPAPPMRMTQSEMSPGGTMPPLPSRHYDATDIPRYGPAPGINHGSLSRATGNGMKPRVPPRAPLEMRGQLV